MKKLLRNEKEERRAIFFSTNTKQNKAKNKEAK